METRTYNDRVQQALDTIQLNRGKDSKKVLTACEVLEEYGKAANDDGLLGFAYFSRGETYYLLNDANNFYTQMISCLQPMENVHQWGYLAIANNMLGIASLNRGNAPYALDYYIKAISICEKYNLPDLEWIIHLNLGSLYLNIDEHLKAINHIEICLSYVKSHKDIDNYIESLTSIYLGLGRAYLKLNYDNKILEIEKKLKNDCLPFLQETDKLVIYCYFARIHNYIKEYEVRDYFIKMINNKINVKMPVMDVFDDFYEYLDMLLETEKYDDFFVTYELLDDLTKRTTIKNLERKLLTLKIRYFRRNGQLEEYKKSSVLYFEFSEFMEKENQLMVSNMIGMRNSYMELTQINEKVEQENTYLQKRSETDPLTGMYNRLKLNEYCEQAFEKAQNNMISIAVEIFDIDYFKQYNDNYGHQKGDDCIRFIAQTVMDFASKEGLFVARYGGDEFIIIYEGLKKDKVEILVKRLRELIYDANIEHNFSLTDKRVTLSQGICYGVPTASQNMYDFLQLADKMLYEVKQKNRNDYMIVSVNE